MIRVNEMQKINVYVVVSVLLFILCISYVLAVPVGPTVTFVSNTTKTASNGSIINGSGTDSSNPDKAGGYIFTINLDSTQQNSRWKAYVGNVTGTLTLDDADDFTIYDWTITTSLNGEVYATRTSGSVNWTGIRCSFDNSTYWEMQRMNHTNSNDNISTTFNDTDNSEFFVGDVQISASTCPTINLYINGTSDLSDNFEEVLLYDGDTNITLTNDTEFKNLVYVSIIEEDEIGYRTNNTYDFQMILPEVGLDSWTESTAYYFYVELT